MSGAADICNCKSKQLMVRDRVWMVDKGLICMENSIGQKRNPEEHLSVQEQEQNND